MVMRFRCPKEQIAEEIRWTEQKLSEEELSALKTNCPTAQKLFIVLDFETDRANLGKAEQFLVALGTVNLLQEHINCLLLRKAFDDQMKDIERPLGSIIDGLLSIQNSAFLTDLFALILRFGNILNDGSPRQSIRIQMRILGQSSRYPNTTTQLFAHKLYLCSIPRYGTLFST
jgi:hypothetical protein